MSDEYDNPENDDSHDEENEEQEFSLDQLSAAYANVLKKQNGDVSEDVSAGESKDEESDSATADNSTESEADQADAEDILDDSPCPVNPLTILEAVLFVGTPQGTKLTAKKIAALMRDVSPKEIVSLVKS